MSSCAWAAHEAYAVHAAPMSVPVSGAADSCEGNASAAVTSTRPSEDKPCGSPSAPPGQPGFVLIGAFFALHPEFPFDMHPAAHRSADAKSKIERRFVMSHQVGE